MIERNINPIKCAICDEFKVDLYLNTHNGKDRFICSDCLDEITISILDDNEEENEDK